MSPFLQAKQSFCGDITNIYAWGKRLSDSYLTVNTEFKDLFNSDKIIDWPSARWELHGETLLVRFDKENDSNWPIDYPHYVMMQRKVSFQTAVSTCRDNLQVPVRVYD